MSGHSKWSSIKGKKGIADAKRGKIFTKLIRELTMAAKKGGGNPDANPSLRMVIAKAREANMPSDNVDRAIKRGTGELPGVIYEELTYEGYGPGGFAILVEVLTDNKNRTTAEIRNLFSKKGGNLAGAGSVSWMFNKKGYIMIDKKDAAEDKLMSVVLDAGAEDLVVGETSYEITTTMQDFEKVKNAVKTNNIPYQVAELTMIPASTVKLESAAAKQALSLVEMLEDQDDVQHVYANFDIPDSILMESAEGTSA
ncbi:MAG: YebC/PmpR family DNA-binding transcriptional regulator [Candidatus Omnitrophota bacterium]